MRILNGDKTAGRDVPDLCVTGLVLDRAAQPHSEHAVGRGRPDAGAASR
jgi:hypothetical protein